MPERFTSVIDAHVILRRAGKILLMRRAGNVYATGQLCFPSGHLERGESILDAALRETREEVGVILQSATLRLALVMHQRNPDGQARIGFFFEPARWDGEPVNCEPAKCSGLLWADPLDPPTDTVPYTAAALRAIQHGIPFALNGW